MYKKKANSNTAFFSPSIQKSSKRYELNLFSHVNSTNVLMNGIWPEWCGDYSIESRILTYFTLHTVKEKSTKFFVVLILKMVANCTPHKTIVH